MKATRRFFGMAVGFAAAVWLVPLAQAGTSVTIQTATTAMGNTPSSQTPVSVGCPSGSTLVGGGFRDFVASDGDHNTTIPTNGLTMHGTYPSDASAGAAANGATNPSDWTAMGGFAAVSEVGDSVTAFAICATGGPTQVDVVTSTVDGPQTAATDAAVTATCPSGTSLVGGGGLTNDGTTQPSFKVIGSFPSDASGASAADGATDPKSWTAVGAAGGEGGAGNTTTAYALCATGASVPTLVARTDDAGNPGTPTTFATATATCPTGTTLIGGGAEATGNSTGGDGGTPQQGVHVRGTYPSSADGSAVDNGASGVDSWTVIVQSGGQPTPGTDTHVWALCLGTATGSGPPQPGQTSLSASGGSGPASGGTGNNTQASAAAGSRGAAGSSGTAGSGGAGTSGPGTAGGASAKGSGASTPTAAAPAPKTTTIRPGAAGSLTVGTGSQGVNVGWTKKGLAKTPLRLRAGFTAIYIPGSHGVSATSAAVAVAVTALSGTPVHRLAYPLDITFPGAAANVTPAYSTNGLSWTRVPELASASLPAGLTDGYYRDDLGALHILTLNVHTDFGLLIATKGLKVSSEPPAFGVVLPAKLALGPGVRLRLAVATTSPGTLTITLRRGARTLAGWHASLGTAPRSLALPLPAAAQHAGPRRLVLTLTAGRKRVVHGTVLELVAAST